jgi:hypothetical protein
MSKALEFYLFGSVICFIWSIAVLKDKNNLIGFGELFFSIFLCAFSWAGVLSLLIAGNIRKDN